MRTAIACAGLLALCAVAQAKVAPQENAQIVIASVDTTIPNGTAGAIPEADYFRAPPSSTDTDRIFPCRLQLRMFDKMRMAQSCH